MTPKRPGESLEPAGDRSALEPLRDLVQALAAVRNAGRAGLVASGDDGSQTFSSAADAAPSLTARQAQLSNLFVRIARNTLLGEARVRRLVERLAGAKRAAAQDAVALSAALAERDALQRQLIDAEDDERRRLSRELHDEAGQRLTAIGLEIEVVEKLVADRPEAVDRLRHVAAVVRNLGRDLHEIAVKLRPMVIDQFGLCDALEAYVSEWSARTGIAIDVYIDRSMGRLPEALEIAFYRAVQEALTNVARHSAATRAAVSLEKRMRNIILNVADNGVGLKVNGRERARLGLQGIRERVLLLGGRVTVDSPAGSGVRIEIVIPVI